MNSTPIPPYSHTPILSSKMQSKDRSFIFNRLDLNTSFMKKQNLLAEAEPDTASIFSGAEEGNEDPVHQGGGNTTSVVSHFDINLTAPGSRKGG